MIREPLKSMLIRSACDTARGAMCLLLLAAAGCSELPTGPADARQMPVRGVTLVDWSSQGYDTDASIAAIGRIEALGANTLPVVITGYQGDVHSNSVRSDNARTPTAASFSRLVLESQSLFMDLVVKVHVDVDTGEWRGFIEPTDASRWFASYREFLLPWAMQAEAWGARQFVFGTELAGTLPYEARWRSLIADVRGVFSGELIYAASWDEAAKVPFWDAVDLVGLNFYAPVAGRMEPHRFEILRGWQPWLDRMRLIHKQAGRDIIVSEIGYRSVDGAGIHPYAFDAEGDVDGGEQADLYWGALQALGDKPWIRGVYWWNWLANPTADDRRDYTPEGKQAAKELSDAWH